MVERMSERYQVSFFYIFISSKQFVETQSVKAQKSKS